MARMVWVFVFFWLAGCGSVGPSATWDPHSRTASARSSAPEVARTDTAQVKARAMIVRHGSDTRYGVGLIVARSDLNYPKVQALRSFGTRLPYKRLDRYRIGYLRAESGLIPMTQAQFQSYADTGLTFRLYARGEYNITLDARIFREALAQHQKQTPN